MSKCQEMQFQTRSRVIDTQRGQALTFGFRLGPVNIFVIANMPETDGNGKGPLVYIKLDLRINQDWEVYSTELPAGTRR